MSGLFSLPIPLMVTRPYSVCVAINTVHFSPLKTLKNYNFLFQSPFRAIVAKSRL